MEYFLILFYLIVLAYIAYKLSIKYLPQINPFAIIGFVLLKMIFGIIYILYHEKIQQGGDIFLYFRDGQIIFNEIYKNPIHFLQLTFGINNIEAPENLSNAIQEMGFWRDTAAYTVVRFNAIFSLVSFGNIYIHGIFSGFLSFIGCFFLTKTFKPYTRNLLLLGTIIFLLPTLLFWTSGIHKEFICTFSFGLIVYGLFNFYNKQKIAYLLLFLFSFGLLALVRIHIALLILPSALGLLATLFINKKPIIIFSIIYLIVIISAYFIEIPFTDGNLIDNILHKKQLFEALKTGNSHIEINQFNNLLGLIKSIPQAFFNTILRPHFFEIKTIYAFFASLESFFFFVSFMGFVLYFRFLNTKQRTFALFFLSFGLSYLIVTGLIVPNIGAILRYRSIAMLALVPMFVWTIYEGRKRI